MDNDPIRKGKAVAGTTEKHREAAPADPQQSDFARSNQGFVRGPSTAESGYQKDLTGGSGFGSGPAEGSDDIGAATHQAADCDSTRALEYGDAGYYAFPETDQAASDVHGRSPKVQQPSTAQRKDAATRPLSEDL